LSEAEIAALNLGETTTPGAFEPANDDQVFIEPEPELTSSTLPEPTQPAPQPEPIEAAPQPEPIEAAAPAPVATPLMREVPAPQPVARPTRAATPAAASADKETPIFTGNDIVDGFLHQLEADPQNDVLRISLARIGWQIGIPDLAVQQYRYMIKHNRALDQVVDEINDLLEDSDEQKLTQRLHRTLGDAYTKQGRFREAIEAYSWTQGGPRSARS